MNTVNKTVLPVGHAELFPLTRRMATLLEQYHKDLSDSGCQNSYSALEIEQLLEQWQQVVQQDNAWAQQFKQHKQQE